MWRIVHVYFKNIICCWRLFCVNLSPPCHRAHHEFCGVLGLHSGRGRRHRLPGPRVLDAGQGAAGRPNTDALRSHSPLYRPDRSALWVEGHLQQRRLGPRAPPHARAVDGQPAAPHTDSLHHRHRHHHHDAGAEAGIRRLRVRWGVLQVDQWKPHKYRFNQENNIMLTDVNALNKQLNWIPLSHLRILLHAQNRLYKNWISTSSEATAISRVANIYWTCLATDTPKIVHCDCQECNSKFLSHAFKHPHLGILVVTTSWKFLWDFIWINILLEWWTKLQIENDIAKENTTGNNIKYCKSLKQKQIVQNIGAWRL